MQSVPTTGSSDDTAPRTALVLYGSETGNAQNLAEEIGRLVERLHFESCVTELNSVTLVRLFTIDCIGGSHHW